MKYHLKYKAFRILCIWGWVGYVLLSGQASAQARWPVTGMGILEPPVSAFLADYYGAQADQLNFSIVLEDPVEPFRMVFFRLSIRSNGTEILHSPPNGGYSPVMLFKDQAVNLSGRDLRSYLDLNSLTPISGFSSSNLLPEGMLSICLEVIDYERGVPLSAPICARAFVQRQEPPLLISPPDRDVIPVERIQEILFYWQARQAYGLPIGYTLEIKEWVPGTNITHAEFDQLPVVFRNDGPELQHLYTETDPPLRRGQTYVWRVQARVMEGSLQNGSTSPSTNNGLSEIWQFTTAEKPDCQPVNTKTDSGLPIALGAIMPPADDFKYPRALPLQAVGIDEDMLALNCSRDGQGPAQFFQIPDVVGNYKWTIKSGPGTLDSPLKVKEIKALQEKLEKEENALAAAAEQLAHLRQRQASLPKDTSKAIKAMREKRSEREQEELGIRHHQDSVIAPLSEDLRKLADSTRMAWDSLASFRTLITEHEQEIDTLKDSLIPRPGTEELRLNEVLKGLSDELNREKVSYGEVEKRLSDRDVEGKEELQVLRDEIDQAAVEYRRQKNIVEGIAQQIANIESQYYMDEGFRDMSEKRLDWEIKDREFLDAYASNQSGLSARLEELREEWRDCLGISDSAQRAAKFHGFKQKTVLHVAQLGQVCGPLRPCRQAWQVVQQSSIDYLDELQSLSESSYLMDTTLDEQIADLRRELYKASGESPPLEEALLSGHQDYQQALGAFHGEITGLNEQLNEIARSIGNLEIEIDSANALYVEATKETLARLEEKRPGIEAEINELEGEIGEFQAAVIIWKNSLSALTKRERKDSLRLKVANLVLEDMRGEVKRLEMEIENLEQYIAFLCKRMVDIKAEIKAQEAVILDKRQAIDHLKKELIRLQKGQRDATGAIVYYVPPPLDELIQNKDRFEHLKMELGEAETEFEKARARLEAYQMFMLRHTEKISRNLVQYQKSGARLAEIKDQIVKAKEDEEDLKGKLDKEYETTAFALNATVDSLEKAKDAYEKAIQRTQELIEEIRAELQELDRQFTDQEAEMKAANQELNGLLNGYKYETRLKENAIASYQKQEGELEELQGELAGLNSTQRQKRSRLIAHQMGGEEEMAQAVSAEIDQLEGELTALKTKIEQAQVGLKASNQVVISAKQRENQAKKIYYEKQDTFDLRIKKENRVLSEQHFQLRDSLANAEYLLVRLQARYSEIVAALAVKKNSADGHEEDFESLVSEDPDVKAAVEEVKKLEEESASLEDVQNSAEEGINHALNMIEKEEKGSREGYEQAKADLELAEGEMKSFLKGEFQRVAYQVELELEGEDQVIDRFRSADGKQTKTIVLKYHASLPQLPEFPLNISDGPPPTDSSQGDLASVEFEAGQASGNPSRNVTWKKEPRVIALQFKDGQPLDSLWPPLPDLPHPLNSEVVGLIMDRSSDSDDMIAYCKTEGEACEPRVTDVYPIEDPGSYGWFSRDGTTLTGSANDPQAFWSVSSEAGKAGLVASFSGNRVFAEASTELKLQQEVWPGVLIPVTDSFQTVPNKDHEVMVRIMQRAGVGLAGQEVVVKAKLVNGESANWGFPGESKVLRTDDDGYAKVDFHSGDGYARFQLSFTWEPPNGAPPATHTLSIASPLLLDAMQLRASVPKKAWDLALGLVKDKEKGFNPAALPGDLNFDKEGADEPQVQAFVGLRDFNCQPVPEWDVKLKITEKGKENGRGLRYKKKIVTDGLGLARSLVEKVKKETEYQMTASVEDVYCPGSPDTLDFSNEQVKSIWMGRDKSEGRNLLDFEIQLEEEVSPDLPITTTGKLVLPESAGMVLRGLGDVVLQIQEVEVEKVSENGKEIFRARKGRVVWGTSSPLNVPMPEDFGLEVDSILISIQGGLGMSGSMKHTKLPKPIEIEAIMNLDGDFTGTAGQLPGVEIKGFKLKPGAKVSIDWHQKESPHPFKKVEEFRGIIVHDAKLIFPESFKANPDDPASEVTVKDFYLGKTKAGLGWGGEIGWKGKAFQMGYRGFEFSLDSANVRFGGGQIKSGLLKGKLSLPGILSGEAQMGIKYQGETWTGEIETSEPIPIKSLKSKLHVLTPTSISYDGSKQAGVLKLTARLETEHFGDIQIKGFEMDSKGEMKVEELGVEDINRTIKFGSGFKLELAGISIRKVQDAYGLEVRGGLSFPSVPKVNGSFMITNGGGISANLDEIEIDMAMAKLKGKFNLSEREFRGSFEGKFKKLSAGKISATLVAGNAPVEGDPKESYTYWYGELGIPARIPLAQTGLSILGLGGGLGYNYSPPIGVNEGHPNHSDWISLKASLTVGDVGGGNLFAGRLTSVYEAEKFLLNGKVWFLGKEESLMAEGQLELNWAQEAELKGYLKMMTGIPDEEGDVFRLAGKVDMYYGPEKWYVKSDHLEGSFMKSLFAEASVSLNKDEVHFAGKLTYDKDLDFKFGPIGLYASVDVEGEADFHIQHADQTLNASLDFHGDWDVDVGWKRKRANVVSGNINLNASLNSSPSDFGFSAEATVRYRVFVFSGSHTLKFT